MSAGSSKDGIPNSSSATVNALEERRGREREDNEIGLCLKFQEKKTRMFVVDVHTCNAHTESMKAHIYKQHTSSLL